MNAVNNRSRSADQVRVTPPILPRRAQVLFGSPLPVVAIRTRGRRLARGFSQAFGVQLAAQSLPLFQEATIEALGRQRRLLSNRLKRYSPSPSGQLAASVQVRARLSRGRPTLGVTMLPRGYGTNSRGRDAGWIDRAVGRRLQILTADILSTFTRKSLAKGGNQ